MGDDAHDFPRVVAGRCLSAYRETGAERIARGPEAPRELDIHDDRISGVASPKGTPREHPETQRL